MLAQSPAWMMPTLMGQGSCAERVRRSGVAYGLELRERTVQALERRDRAVAGRPHRTVGRPSDDLDAEGQRAGVGGDDLPVGRLGDDTRVTDMAAAQGGVRAEAAVLLADHGVQGVGATELDAADRPCGRDDRHDSALHVADAAAVPPLVDLAHQPRVGVGPGLRVAGRHDVDVTVEDQRRRAGAGDADTAQRLFALDLLAGIVGRAAELVEVEVPLVDLEAEARERRGAPALDGDLGIRAADAGDVDDLREVAPDQVDVDVQLRAHGADGIAEAMAYDCEWRCARLMP